MSNEVKNDAYVIKAEGGIIEVTDEGFTMIRNTKDGVK